MNNMLGPRSIGGILGETFRIYGRDFWRLLAIVAIVEVSLGILAIGLTLLAIMPAIMGGGGIASLIPLIVIGIIVVAGYIIAYPLMTGALIHAISEQHFHQPISIGRAYRYAWGRIKALIGASILVALIMVGIAAAVILIGLAIIPATGAIGWVIIGLLATVALVAMVYLWTRWIFILQAALLEGCGATAALSRSSALVRGTWWRVFGFMLVVSLIVVAISAALGMIPIVGGIIGGLLSIPIGIAGATLLYYDLRVRKEGYSLDALAEELQVNINSDIT